MLTRMPRKKSQAPESYPPPPPNIFKMFKSKFEIDNSVFLFTSYLISDITYLSVKAFLFKIITLSFFIASKAFKGVYDANIQIQISYV